MRRLRIIATACVLSVAANLCNAQVELLTSGDFELVGGEIPGWSLVESIYDQTTMMDRDPGLLNTAQQQDFGPNSGDLALWLRPFAGGMATGPNNLTNAILSQEVPVTAGQEYTFSGFSRYEFDFGGAGVTLNSTGPLGAVPSPNTTSFKMEFLDGSNNVIGSAFTEDVTASRASQAPFNDPYDNSWYETSITQVAPAGAANVRVTAESRQMVWNSTGANSLFFDTFSVADTATPMTNLLTNSDLEEEPPEFDPAWTVTEVPEGTNTIASAPFANRPDSEGSLGAWLRSFSGSTEEPADAILTQTVPGSPGEEYTLSGWSRWETNYSGGAAGFSTQTILELAFLDAGENEIGTPVVLDLAADGQTNGGGWMEHELSATAPAGTVSVRAKAAGLDMVSNPAGGQQSAFFDDLSLTAASVGLLADVNGDLVVDGADFLQIQRDNPSLITDFQNEYGMSTSVVATAAAVPEPSALLCLLLCSLAGCSRVSPLKNRSA